MLRSTNQENYRLICLNFEIALKLKTQIWISWNLTFESNLTVTWFQFLNSMLSTITIRHRHSSFSWQLVLNGRISEINFSTFPRNVALETDSDQMIFVSSLGNFPSSAHINVKRPLVAFVSAAKFHPIVCRASSETIFSLAISRPDSTSALFILFL